MMTTQKNLTRRALLTVAALALAGCASVSKIEVGEITVKNRLAVTTTTAWNQFERGLGDDTPTWTKEGITIDALQFYVGIKDGGLLAATPSNTKGVAPLIFKAGMQPAEVVALYQGLVTRDGSSFILNRIAPMDFVGVTGFRFEYELTRKIDDVRLQGVAYAGVRNGELFMINYSAPRLRFFATYAPQAETLARSARVKS